MNEQQPSTTPTNDSTASYPVQAQIPYPETSSRGLALASLLFFVKMLLLIPHLIVLYFLGLFSLIAFVIGQVIVLIKGVYPPSLFALVKAISIWQLRVNAYSFGLTDQYPPIAFDEADRASAMSALKNILIGIVIFVGLIILLIIFTNN